MPEIAEVKMYARNLDKLLGGSRIEAVRSFTGEDFRSLEGKEIKNVRSYGKGIYFDWTEGGNLYVHLMLTGGFYFVGEEDYASVPGKLLAVKIRGRYLILSDVNRYAVAKTDCKTPETPEAGSERCTEKYFLSVIKGRGAVKNALTDQSRIVGLGNAYADEILYETGISPFSAAANIPLAKLKELYAAVSTVLNRAEKYLSERSPDMIRGEDRGFFAVHVKGLAFTSCGEPILVKALSGRKTYYTEEQTLY